MNETTNQWWTPGPTLDVTGASYGWAVNRFSHDMPTSHRYSADGICIPTRELRYVLTATLVDANRRMTVSELARTVDEFDIAIAGRATKAVSDALRAELGRGRIRRVSWGVYEGGIMPESTWRYVRRRARVAIANYAGRAKRVAQSPGRLKPVGAAEVAGMAVIPRKVAQTLSPPPPPPPPDQRGAVGDDEMA